MEKKIEVLKMWIHKEWSELLGQKGKQILSIKSTEKEKGILKNIRTIQYSVISKGIM